MESTTVLPLLTDTSQLLLSQYVLSMGDDEFGTKNRSANLQYICCFFFHTNTKTAYLFLFTFSIWFEFDWAHFTSFYSVWSGGLVLRTNTYIILYTCILICSNLSNNFFSRCFSSFFFMISFWKFVVVLVVGFFFYYSIRSG